MSIGPGRTLNVRFDPLLGKPCLGFSVLTWLTPNAGWLELQHELARRIPVPLALTEPSLLHVSIQLLIPVRDARTDKEEAWQRIRGEVLHAFRQCAALWPFRLEFDELRILERAIILVARECKAMETIRARFHSVLEASDMPVHRHDIVHTTLARYHTDGTFQVPDVCIKARSVEVSSLNLVRERSYGLHERDDLAACVLRR